MKILIATGIYPPEIGGPATYAELLARELPKRGIEVEVLPFRVVRKYPPVIRHLIYGAKIIHRALSGRADIIFTQDPGSTGVPSIFAGVVTRRKVVMRIAGDYAWELSSQRFGVSDTIDEFQTKRYGFSVELRRFVQSLSVRLADVVVSPSKYFAHLVSGWNDHKREVLPIYNGIDLSMPYDRSPKYDKPTIVTAGRLVSWKGVDTLIRSLPLLPEWNLHVAGDGPDKTRLEALALELKVSDRVVFLGQIDRKKLFEEIARSQIFALLSTFESFSFQVVEAMHIGVPVIAADIGNLSEIITDKENGRLIKPGDPEVFADVVRGLAADPEAAQKMAENGMRRAEDFSIEHTIDAMAGIFKKLAV